MYNTKFRAEYIWIDGTTPTQKLRSKTKILDQTVNPVSRTASQIPIWYHADSYPVWGFDGSSTNQATGHDSDCVLVPVLVVQDPIRKGNDVLVLCEVMNADGVTPHPSNKRADLRKVLSAGAAEMEPWFGIEQEYTLFKGTRPLGFPDNGFPSPQGPYYCGVGADEVVGRALIEAHTKACMDAGLLIAGTNAEVMPGQWEFQIGAGPPLRVADHLWLARWLLYRIGEDYGINASLDPKPVRGDWNGAGAHTNFSTAAMRSDQPSWDANGSPIPTGLEAIYDACRKLGQRTAEHLAVYGHGIEGRLTGAHETCSYKEFRFGVADRSASIRIPRQVANAGCGYLEDRRPCANACPYEISTRILKTICF